MITFSCGNCGRRIKAGDGSAGKKGTCPGCGTIVTIPEDLPLRLKPEEKFDNQGDLKLRQEPTGKPRPKLVFARRIEPQIQESFLFAEEEGKPPKRKLPFILDIFLYPTSLAGLVVIGIVFGIPFLIGVIAFLAGPFGFFISIPGFFINFVVFAYFFWYLCECVRDSAEGNIRAPDVLIDTPGLGEMAWQMLRIIICLFIFLGPCIVYYYRAGEADAIFWMLLGAAVVLFPVALLTVVMHDSFVGLNPFLLIKSVFRTFFPYLGLVFLFGSFAVLVVYVANATALLQDITVFLILLVYLYIFTMMAHLLGWFYWKNKDRLGWDV